MGLCVFSAAPTYLTNLVSKKKKKVDIQEKSGKHHGFEDLIVFNDMHDMYILRFEKPISVPQIPLPQLFEYLLYPTKIHKKERTGHIETFFFFFHQHPNMIYLFIKNLDMTGFQNFFFIFPELALRSLPLKILNSSYKPTHASNLVNSNLYHGFFFVFVCLFIFSLSTVSSGIA